MSKRSHWRPFGIEPPTWENTDGVRLINLSLHRPRGEGRPRGSALITTATVLLGLLAAGLFVVSLAAQYRYVFAVKHQSVPAMIEAVGLDVGMAIFSLLALGLAMAGQSARVERALIVACALGSAGMNYAAANGGSPRSVAAYVVPPVFLAIVVDRVVAVVRRHVLGEVERSAWATLGRGLAAVAKALGLVLLYLVRFALAAPSTASGVRRQVLIMTPLPSAELPAAPELAIEPAVADQPRPEPKPLPELCGIHTGPTSERPWFGPCLRWKPCPLHPAESPEVDEPQVRRAAGRRAAGRRAAGRRAAERRPRSGAQRRHQDVPLPAAGPGPSRPADRDRSLARRPHRLGSGPRGRPAPGLGPGRSPSPRPSRTERALLMKLKIIGGLILALALLYYKLGELRFALLGAAVALLVASFYAAKWTFVPRSELPRNRVRHQRLRLYLYLHPGRGHATWWELHRQWSRRAAYKRASQVRPS